jgi:hypothetical protein
MPILSYTITQEIIDQGCEQDNHAGNNCPHYQAAIERIKELGWADAHFAPTALRLYHEPMDVAKWWTKRVDLPEDVYDWINQYDMDKPVSPATFAFEIPLPPSEQTDE